MAVNQEMMGIALDIRRNMSRWYRSGAGADHRGGLDVINQRDAIQKIVPVLHEATITVSLFVDPDLEQVKASHKRARTRWRSTPAATPTPSATTCARPSSCGSPTRSSSRASSAWGLRRARAALRQHPALAALPEVEEFNIGHAIVARAMMTGMEAAVREMKRLIVEAALAGRAS